jgi:hypothetical protein
VIVLPWIASPASCDSCAKSFHLKKYIYLSTNISQQIAWYPPSQTLVCSAIDELKNQPFVVLRNKFRVCCGIAVLLAKYICLGMFRVEVEDINGKSNVIKERIFIVSDHACEGAVVVKEYVVRLHIFMKCMLDHFLFRSE